MKALLRDEGETVTQDAGLTFIDWDTGTPLTNPDWYGGPYILVEEYVEPDITDTETEFGNRERDAAPTTVSYGGKEYTLEELKKLIG